MDTESSREDEPPGGLSGEGEGYTLEEIFGEGMSSGGVAPERSKFLCLLGFGGGAVHEFVHLSLSGGPGEERMDEGGGVAVMEAAAEGDEDLELGMGAVMDLELVDLTPVDGSLDLGAGLFAEETVSEGEAVVEDEAVAEEGEDNAGAIESEDDREEEGVVDEEERAVKRTVWEQLEAMEAEKGVDEAASEKPKIPPPRWDRGAYGGGEEAEGKLEEGGVTPLPELAKEPPVLAEDELTPVSRVRKTEDGRLLAACPVCMHFLNVNEQMVGVSGACPECQAGIVAVEREGEDGEPELVIETLRPMKMSPGMGPDGRPIVPMGKAGGGLSADEDLEVEDGLLLEGDEAGGSGRLGAGKWSLPPGAEGDDEESATGIVPASGGRVDPVALEGGVDDESGEPLVFGVKPQQRAGGVPVEREEEGDDEEVEAEVEEAGEAESEEGEEEEVAAKLGEEAAEGDGEAEEAEGEEEIEGGGEVGDEKGEGREVGLDEEEEEGAEEVEGRVLSKGVAGSVREHQMATILELTGPGESRGRWTATRVLVLLSVLVGCAGLWAMSLKFPVEEWWRSVVPGGGGEVAADSEGAGDSGDGGDEGLDEGERGDGLATPAKGEVTGENRGSGDGGGDEERELRAEAGENGGGGEAEEKAVSAPGMAKAAAEVEEGDDEDGERASEASGAGAAIAKEGRKGKEVDLSTLTEKERVVELSKRVLTEFLDAEGWEAKRAYVLGGDDVGPAMEAFYEERDEESFRGLVTTDGAIFDETTGLWVAAMNIWEVGKPTYLLTYVVGNDEKGFKVDWEWYEQMKTHPLQEFFAHPMGDAREMRVMMRRSSFLGTVPEGEEEPLAVVLVSPFESPFTGTIYLAPESPQNTMMGEALRWGEDRMATVRLKWVRDRRYGDAPRVVIEDLMGWGLAIERAYPQQP